MEYKVYKIELLVANKGLWKFSRDIKANDAKKLSIVTTPSPINYLPPPLPPQMYSETFSKHLSQQLYLKIDTYIYHPNPPNITNHME